MFTIRQAERSLVRHGVFRRSECLAEKGSNPLGIFSHSILSHKSQALGIAHLEHIRLHS